MTRTRLNSYIQRFPNVPVVTMIIGFTLGLAGESVGSFSLGVVGWLICALSWFIILARAPHARHRWQPTSIGSASRPLLVFCCLLLAADVVMVVYRIAR
jgi:hypothetical protein